MSLFKRIMLFFILPIFGTLLYQPSMLAGAFSGLWIVAVFFFALGYLIWRGYSTAMTFMIFVMGMNAVVRIMMVLSTAFNKEGVFNLPFTAFGLAGAAISFYLMLRLDKVDVVQHMTR